MAIHLVSNKLPFVGHFLTSRNLIYLFLIYIYFPACCAGGCGKLNSGT